MNGATDSEIQLFKNLANPQRVDMSQQKKPASYQPNMIPVEETDFVSSEGGRSSNGSRKRKQRTPPASYYEEEEEEDNRSSRTAYSRTKKGRAEKVGFLMELKKLRMQGCHLTREYSTKDKLEDIKYEFERQKMNLDCINSVALMSDGLKLGLSGLEMANNKLGPFLHLHGWSESVTQDMSRYNHVLERIYRKYWRQGSLNPLVELGMLLVGSMMMYHFQNKFLGPQMAPAKPQAQNNIPIDRNVQNNNNNNRSTRSKRPTMRPPNQGGGGGGLFGNMNAPAFNNPPAPVFTNIEQRQQTTPEIREVEERGPSRRRQNNSMEVERVEEPEPTIEEAAEEETVPAYEEEEMKIGDALDIDI